MGKPGRPFGSKDRQKRVLDKPCPRCGAPYRQQKYKRRIVDLAKLENPDFVNPVDGVICPHCNQGFRVGRLEVEEGFFADLTEEFESVPKYCPYCKTEIEVDE